MLDGIKRLVQNPGMHFVFLFYLINDLGNKGALCFLLRRIYYSWQIKYGISIQLNTEIGKRLSILHFGNIIINPKSKIGDCVTLMQGVTVGSSMRLDLCPSISDRCLLGAGSKVIGDVFLAPEIKVGANAVVTRSCCTVGATLVGVPAREINK